MQMTILWRGGVENNLYTEQIANMRVTISKRLRNAVLEISVNPLISVQVT